MSEILLAVGLFTGIVLLLVGLVLAARARLLPTGEASILVNGSRTLRARKGEKLLAALEAGSLYLPSGCGGKGTCAQCQVEVLRGGGPPLATETARLLRSQLARGVRLACQITLREDLEVRVPDEILGVQRWRCRVRSSRFVGTLLKEIVLELPAGAEFDARAGRFVQVTAPPGRVRFSELAVDPGVRDEWDRLAVWRFESRVDRASTRAYSMANHPGERDVLILIVRLALPPPGAPEDAPPGVVSSYLFSLRPGDEVDVSGPYGHFFVADTENEMIFVGGGAGMAPMRAHLFDQLVCRGTRRKVSFWYGARSRRELFYVEEFDRLQAEHPNFRWVAALSEPRPEDHWQGEVGFIHEVLHRRHLADHPHPEDCEYYLCGPPLMVKALRNLLDDLGVDPERVFFDDFSA